MNNFPQQNQQKLIPNTNPTFFQQGGQTANQFPLPNKNQQVGFGNPQIQVQPQVPLNQQIQGNPPTQFNQFNQQNNQNILQAKPQGQITQFGIITNPSQNSNTNVNPPNQINTQINFTMNNQKPQVIQPTPNQFQKPEPAKPFMQNANQNISFPNQQGVNKFQMQPQKPECETKPQQQFPQMMKPSVVQPQMQIFIPQQKYPRVEVKSEEDRKQLVKNLNQYFQDGNSEFAMECIKQIIENDIRIKLPEQSINIK